jgi:hypothetical protein
MVDSYDGIFLILALSILVAIGFALFRVGRVSRPPEPGPNPSEGSKTDVSPPSDRN